MIRKAGLALGAYLGSALTSFALAQQVPPAPQDQRRRDLPLESCLQDAERLARSLPLAAVRQAVGAPFVTIADDRRVHVELVAPEGQAALPRGFVAPFGGRPDTRWRNRLDAWVPLDTLLDLARALPPGHRIERASAGEPDQVAGEGPAAIGSDVYRNGGANGNGVTIAVIDAGFFGLSAARANGDAPTLANSTLINYTPTAFESDTDHGTGCVEAAFDHCPGATWRIYKIDSVADLGTAVSDALANSVDVITHSLSRYNQGWADGTGAACAAAQQAGNGGIVFLTSAGNRAQQHWQGNFVDTDGDGWHDFSTGDETIDLQFPPNSGASFYLSWNTGAGTADYDLHLWDGPLVTPLASGTSGGSTFESFWFFNNSPATLIAHLTVKKKSGANLELELFAHGGVTWAEYAMAQGSTTSPSNSTHANVLSVGAVDWVDFGSAPGATGILMDYSSRGPSNSGMTLPDLIGPTNTQGFTFPGWNGGFTGTSCATPNAAGALAAHWSSVTPFTGGAERWLYLEQTRLHRDWGAGGNDNLYGRGGASLAPFAANTVWLARGWGNVTNQTSGPYYTLAAAYQAVATGGRILALPGGYVEHPPAQTKAHRLESFEGSAVFGN